MASSFIPIMLMVVAGFLLGLLVGRLAWSSSKSKAAQQPRVPKDEPEEKPTTGSLPVWEMEEVVPLERQGPTMPPIDIKKRG